MQTGPKASEPGYASVCEAYGGFRHLNGYTDRPPVRPNISLGDTLAGLHAAFGTVMALYHRQKVRGLPGPAGAGPMGGGQVVDASISESVFNMLEGCVAEYAMAGQDRPPSGSTISGGWVGDCVCGGALECCICRPGVPVWLGRAGCIWCRPPLDRKSVV